MDEAGPTTLLGMAARMSTDNVPDAVAALRHLGLPPTRAQAAVRHGGRLASGQAHDPIGYLAGVSLSGQQTARLRALLPSAAAADGAAANRVSIGASRTAWARSRIAALASAAASSGDSASQLVAAALITATRPKDDLDFVGGLTDGLKHTFGTGTKSLPRRTSDRVLATAYALEAASRSGLALGSKRWNGASKNWLMAAAPWLLYILEPQQPAAVEELLAAAHGRGLQFLTPDDSAKPAPRSVSEHARNHAAGTRQTLTRWAGRPLWFDGGRGQTQVLFTEDDDYAYAWVGSSGKGSFVRFDTQDFTGYALDDPASTYALPIAIGWFIDASVTLRGARSGSSTIRRATGGSQRNGYRYVPTATFTSQVGAVASHRSTPPSPHAVAAHIRRLKTRRPDPATVEQAPPRLRRQMGPHDTYVRAHERGGSAAAAAARARLSKHSALADILGLLGRGK